ncbi:MAG: LytTR family transcriptional regulator, partial [Syntrophomonas sp.]
IAGGAYSGYALKSDGTVWAWGNNQGSQLGDHTGLYIPYPVQVSGLTGVTAIAGGFYSGYALKSDGTVWAWGLNNYEQLGSPVAYSSFPVQVSGLKVK